jgi:hypothetical protein
LDDEDLPEDIDDSDRYLAVPSQHDLDLGQRPLLVADIRRIRLRTGTPRIPSSKP